MYVHIGCASRIVKIFLCVLYINVLHNVHVFSTGIRIVRKSYTINVIINALYCCLLLHVVFYARINYTEQIALKPLNGLFCDS